MKPLKFKYHFYVDNPNIDVIRVTASDFVNAMATFNNVLGIELSGKIIEVVRIDIE